MENNTTRSAEKTLVSRSSVFLAKIAGEEVDFGVLTPDVPINNDEKLFLYIAERADSLEERIKAIEDGGYYK